MDSALSVYDSIAIRILPNGVSFRIRDKAGKTLLSEKTEQPALPPSEAVQEAILLSGVLEKPCKKIKIVFFAPHFTLLPEDVFDAETVEDYYKAVVGDLSGKLLLHQCLAEMGLYIVFAIDEAMHDFLSRSFISFEVEHHLSSMLTFLGTRYPHTSKRAMYVSYEGQLLSIMLFKEGAFFSANAFHCASVDDALYYILATWKQARCDQMTDGLHIVEEGEFQEALLRELRRYIKQAVFLLINKEDL